jgi:hypothetical protein
MESPPLVSRAGWRRGPDALNTGAHKEVPVHQADLHNHTTASDGDFSPTQLIQRYAALGVDAVAVTDHDTIAGLREALEAGRAAGVDVVPGVEVTLRFSEALFRGSLHLLLYFDAALLDDQAFLDLSAATFAKGRGDSLVQARLVEINRYFGPAGVEPRMPRELTADDLYGQTDQVSRRHFAVALKGLGITDRDEISHIIGNDSPAYIPSGMTFEDLEPLLAAYPFVRVFAHPAAGSFPGDSHYKEVLPPFETVVELLPRFEALGLDGLEVFYPGHTASLEAAVDALLVERGLPIGTGGSDCHDESQRPPGTAGCGIAVVQAIRELLAARA